jgi:hypothetical protein
VRRTRPAGGDSSRVERLQGLLGTRTGRALRFGVVVAVGFLGVSLVLRQARAAVDRLPGCRLGQAKPVFLDLPRWVDDDMRARLEAPGVLDALRTRRGGRAPPPLQIFDPGVERAIADALSRHPMVQSVSEVEVRFPSEVRVRASIRAPVALVRTRVLTSAGAELRDVPVSGDGVVLPEVPYARFLAERRPVVVLGVRARFPGRHRRWDDTDEQVREAVEAARVANRLNEELLSHDVRVEGVDVSRFPATPRLRKQGEVILLLSDGRRVQWGRTERDLTGVEREDTYAVKRDRLLDVLDDPSLARAAELDVRVGRPRSTRE